MRDGALFCSTVGMGTGGKRQKQKFRSEQLKMCSECEVHAISVRSFLGEDVRMAILVITLFWVRI